MELRQPSDDNLDRLLADHLVRQAEREDVGSLLTRIQTTVKLDRPTVRKSWTSRVRQVISWSVPVAVAIGIAVVVLLPTHPEPLKASPQALLQEAQKAHHLPLDRCYLVEFQRQDDPADEGNPLAALSRTTRLWTRGDRFWIESTNPRARWAWGRDESGSIWVAPGPRRGIRVEPEETPRWLAVNCDICEMRPEHLLGELLRDFNLVREDCETPATQVIRAERKPGHFGPPIRSAILELDSDTKALRRVVLDRAGPMRPTTTTYTLVETQTQSDDRYRLEGHLVAPFEILTAENQPFQRRQALALVFGPRALDWFKPLPKEGPKS
ncbi:MAG TPA: hypothetical protein VHR66_07165 [Gemmataceae bacterium]|jgi:hypothetical protein|nr:hypothetical protein [Gemmataceae bacterium]